jgi:ribonuclease R
VYFPRRVIPMLPEKLSNALCSLNPEVDRLCMVCDMLVTDDGTVQAYQFYPAVMWSHARLAYT